MKNGFKLKHWVDISVDLAQSFIMTSLDIIAHKRCVPSVVDPELEETGR